MLQIHTWLLTSVTNTLLEGLKKTMTQFFFSPLAIQLYRTVGTQADIWLSAPAAKTLMYTFQAGPSTSTAAPHTPTGLL